MLNHGTLAHKLQLSIKPPGPVPRVPISLTQCKFWKAHEWQHWLLYSNLLILKGILPQKYHSHWALLIEGVSALLGSELTTGQINHAHDALVYFVEGVQSLYGEENMTFNVHSLLHLSQSVVNSGPIWAHSAFVFEDFNGFLLKQVKSIQAVPQLICNKWCCHMFFHASSSLQMHQQKISALKREQKTCQEIC